ncbi:YbjP/YqhG family protein [Mesorhizobium sp. CA14]|uniref:YbjP/YqhG family protein n=1 Tax=Mesorhizobium sp. CA14 TaxID=2876642 RepID=UPI001CCFA263|nr:YbjP/YqhG family protein [Mesorhizobium sp. CA14]MBZ9847316.1 YbjP/YqhG family protein [Mesorhizobium sp. CA14]
MLRRLVLALSSLSMLVAGLSGGACAQGLFGSPPPKASPDDNAPDAAPPATTPTPQTAPAEPAPAAPVLPGSPTAVVKPFYEHLGLELAPAQRKNFVDPAKTVLDKSDALRASGQGECLDPNMALDNADYDKLAIDRSLRTIEAVNGDGAKVVVAFVVEGDQHRLEWKLKKVGGAWKVSDLLSVTGEWALSQYQCE